jgi:hypothetical protein
VITNASCSRWIKRGSTAVSIVAIIIAYPCLCEEVQGSWTLAPYPDESLRCNVLESFENYHQGMSNTSVSRGNSGEMRSLFVADREHLLTPAIESLSCACTTINAGVHVIWASTCTLR